MYEYDQFGRAAESGDLPTIQRMLTSENPIPVDCICHCVVSAAYDTDDYEYVTPLLLACREGHLDIVQELIRAGADVNWKHVFYKTAPDDDDRQNGGSLDWVKRVFSMKAFRNSTTICMNTPLHEACFNARNPEVVEALLAAGADVNFTICKGFTPLMSVATADAPITSRVKIGRLLIAANCNVNQETQDGDTALVLACRRYCDSDDMIRLLCEHGARITPEAAFACFHYLNDRGSFARINGLLEHGMDVNVTDEKGRTIMNLATLRCENLDLIRLLLDHNADLSIQDQSGRTALMNASINISRDYEFPIINMLLERMNTVDRKKSIDLQDVNGYTALHFAARRSGRVIHELLNCAPNLLCQAGDASSTALHCALDVWDGSVRLSNLRCLVEHVNGYGLDGINIQDGQGRTVLHLALEKARSNKSVIEYLSTKVDVSIQDVEGNTPLHMAVNCDDSEVWVH